MSDEKDTLDELRDILKNNKKAWLVPLALIIAILVLLVIMARFSWSPFVYTKF
jgi:hypothetical protein